MSNSFYIDLNELSSKKPRVIRLLIFGACICITFAITSVLIFFSSNSPIEWVFVVVALYIALYIYFAWLAFKAKLFVKADNYCFEYKFGLFKRDKNIIIWDTIKKVRIGPAYIGFYKKSGKRKVVRIGWLPYSRVIEIKENLFKIIKEKNINLEIGEIIKYEKKKPASASTTDE